MTAGFGIIIMRGVAACELQFTRYKVVPAVRPMIGGALVGLMAILSPQVMSSGHGALHLTGLFKLPLATIALIFILKALASIVARMWILRRIVFRVAPAGGTLRSTVRARAQCRVAGFEC